MRLSRLSLLFISTFIILFLVTPLLANDQIKVKPMRKSPEPGFYQRVPDEIIVKFKSDVTDEEIEEINNGFGAKVKKQKFSHGKFKVLKVKKNKSLDDLLAKYKKHPKVARAVQNTICYAQWEPNDPYYSPYQWNFQNSMYGGINMEFAWDVSRGSSDVIVAVLDTGVAQHGSDFADTNFVPGIDYINNDDDPTDDEGHGTHVAGTIAQSTDNGLGVAGIAPDASIMPIKVLDAAGRGDAASLASGIRWATENGAKVINMSLSWPSCYNPGWPVDEAIADANGLGVTLVAAAGNDGLSCVNYPAAYEEVIAVGATEYEEERAYYSSYGTALDLTAPGGDVGVDKNGDGVVDGIVQQTFGDGYSWGYYLYQGTSMASPHVAGVAALLIADDPTRGPVEVRHILESSAEDKGDAGWDPVFGHGLLDAHAALMFAGTVPANAPPTAKAGGPYSADVDSTITFDGSGSYDPDGDDSALIFKWDFGDETPLFLGTGENGAYPDHTYMSSGNYEITLTVNDGQADSIPSTANVSVTTTSGSAPVVPTLSVLKPTGYLSWKRTRAKAIATVKVVDDGGAGISGATITATWAGAYSRSVTLVTDSSGSATSETRYVNKPQQPFIFTVLDVDKADYISGDMPPPMVIDLE